MRPSPSLSLKFQWDKKAFPSAKRFSHSQEKTPFILSRMPLKNVNIFHITWFDETSYMKFSGKSCIFFLKSTIIDCLEWEKILPTWLRQAQQWLQQQQSLSKLWKFSSQQFWQCHHWVVLVALVRIWKRMDWVWLHLDWQHRSRCPREGL